MVATTITAAAVILVLLLLPYLTETIFPRIYACTYYAHPRARVMSFSTRLKSVYLSPWQIIVGIQLCCQLEQHVNVGWLEEIAAHELLLTPSLTKC